MIVSAMSQPDTKPYPDTLEINAARLLGRIESFAKIGQGPDGGITREGFSDADLDARAALIGEARACGLEADVDAAGNILIRRAATGPVPAHRKVLMMGSHLDTVVNAGRLDGVYGVLAALEVLQVLAESGTDLPCEPVAVAFANEEGALFPQPFWGSMALAGRLDELPAQPCDHDGHSLRAPLARAGGNLDELESAVWPTGSVAAYLELHIEQGPVLERAGRQIGVVDAITGRAVLTVQVTGASGHAGTTPMDHRRDAMVAAARMVTAVEHASKEDGLCRVATVGRLETQPNSPNSIAGTARLTIDLRDTDPGRLERVEATVRDAIRVIAEQTGTRVDYLATTRSTPVATAPELRAAITRSAEELGLTHRTLPSGAGHDAQMVADIAPIGMIFVPSIGGVSHVPEEDTSPADLVSGAQVLLRTVLRV
ncbi:M20 family metallo-hydrolase [Streptomyces sp. NPDC059467]|uniref:M20 family metallo-hydrolase n=1 Tax=Streptomyces sp. NPDC059467 TaxID=3346844 RepID=UPI0036A530F7